MQTLFFSCSDHGRRATNISTNPQLPPGGGDGGGSARILALVSSAIR